MPVPGKVKNIVELAALAGVSPGTVSRALANSTLISKSTRERIQALAREHDFRPNVMAQNFRFKRTGAIGVVIPVDRDVPEPLSDPLVTTLLGHIADALAERGRDLLLTRIVPSDPAWLGNAATSGRTDGILLLGQADQMAAINAVAEDYLPLVAWGAHVAGQAHCTVGSDNEKGGFLAARHLIERGCRRLAFLGNPRAPELAQRLDGCRRAMAAAGIGGEPVVLDTALSSRTAYPVILAWLRDCASPPDGIVAGSDIIAMSALRALDECSLPVPGRVRIIGYDNLTFAGQTHPPLSTIGLDLEAGAGHLVDLLLRRIAGETTPSVVLEPELVVRAST